MDSNTGTFFNINDNDGIPLVGVSTNGRVLINHLYGNCLIGSTSVTGTVSQPLQVTGGAYVSGNLGIGITNPTSPLVVVGTGVRSATFRSAPTTSPANFDVQEFFLWDRTTAVSGLTLSGADNRLLSLTVSPSNDITFRAESLALLSSTATKFYVNNSTTEAARFDSAGNLLVGSTSSTGTASQPLQVTGGAYVFGNLGIGTTTPGRILDIYSASGSNTVKLTASGQSAGFIVDSVGINSRGGYFAAYQGGVQRGIFGVSGTVEGNTTTDAAILADGTGGNIRFYTDGSSTEKARINSSGNLGIGTTNPTSKLDVRGDLKVGINTFQGLILTAPNGTQYRLIVSNAGALSTVAI